MSRCSRREPLSEEVRQAADLLGRRWLIQVLFAAHEGSQRFNEFRQALGDVPPRTLAARLVELEEAGVLVRVVVDARPPRVEYRLTDEGRRLAGVVEALQAWACSRAGASCRPPGAGR